MILAFPVARGKTWCSQPELPVHETLNLRKAAKKFPFGKGKIKKGKIGKMWTGEGCLKHLSQQRHQKS